MTRRASLGALAIVIAAIGGGAPLSAAHAQPASTQVALLPLDADPRLAIYGQAVASEIGRALVAGSLDAVVVGPKMAVPATARLIIDGTIAAGKGDAVVLSLRIRNPIDGTVLHKLDVTAPNLAQIDQAAARISTRLLPIVREQIMALRPSDRATVTQVRPPVPAAGRAAPRSILVGIRGWSPVEEPFRRALTAAVDRWTRGAHREPRTVDPSTLIPQLAPQTVASAGAERAIAFEIMGLAITPGGVPLARARVRVRISDARAVVFDRIVFTDTIVGERQMAPDALAARVALEVLAIVRPHMRKAVTPWP